MIKARQNIVSSSKYNIKCPHSMSAQYITYHNTYNDASADNEIRYMISNNNATGYHFAVDDKEVVQGIPTNRNAWHCGDGNGNGNRKSIGVEVCYSKSGGDRYYKAEKLANKFIAQLLHERGWGVDRVRTHFSWSKKNCPHRILDESRWSATLKDIQNELNKLKGAAISPAPSVALKYGDTGERVKKIQEDLNILGYGLEVDGSFGRSTLDAVNDFQKKHSLEVDGRPGTATQNAINREIAKLNNKPSKETIRIFNPTSVTLKQAVEKEIAQAVEDMIVNVKWLVKLQNGALSLDDALALKVIIDQRRNQK